MNRTTWQQLSEERIADAETLLVASRWSGAYYLCGYAIECAMKACIMLRVEQTGIIFEEKKFAEQCWTHDFKVLVDLAGLGSELRVDRLANAVFDQNCAEIEIWSEHARYRTHSRLEAETLFQAINDPNEGVLQWLKRRW